MLETDCAHCPAPAAPPRPQSLSEPTHALDQLSPGAAIADTTFHIEGLGHVPVLKGDLTWLPAKVISFICEKARLMRPSAIRICNGSVFEASEMAQILKAKGVLEEMSSLNNVFVARTDPSDTMRVEKNTFIVTKNKVDVQPILASSRKTANYHSELAQWMSPNELQVNLDERFPGCMQGRTMYVIPFSMGPIAGRVSKNAVQLTDSPYVVLNMRVVARVSSSVWDSIGTRDFVKCIHSVGVARPVMKPLVRNWACNTSNIFIAHRIEQNELWSYGSGYGGNSLLGKKCLALRIGSYLGYQEGWLAEHAAIVSVTDPSGKEIFVCVSFPSGAGKTALAMMTPSLPGWKVKVLGDDIAWIRWKDGEMYAMAPENGMFGIAADVRPETGSNIIEMLKSDALIVNCATTNKGRPFWQGMESTLQKDEVVTDWKQQPWYPDSKTPPAHPNSRFTVYTSNAPNVHPKWDSEFGVPISAYIFGSRRPDKFPLVFESNNWDEGVVLAAGARSKVGSGTDRKSDGLVHDPMSMRPFMAYNFGRYVDHWMSMGAKGGSKAPPKIFHVNWYQEDDEGKVIWPGFNENIRVLEWIFRRVQNPEDDSNVVKSTLGLLPKGLNTEGLSVDISPLLKVHSAFWLKEFAEIKRYFDLEMGEDKPSKVEKIVNSLATSI